ncbi:MAG: NAD(P)/FAD-dependent oxidoreductase [Rubrivivax sp.]
MTAANAPAPISTDAVVIGAGPAGLFQVFELGLLEMQAQVVDALPQPGGQCVELYADKPIYDIPGLPVCSGRELTQRLLQQIAPFGAGMHLGQEVTTLQRRDDGCFDLATDRGTRFIAKVVVIAGGVGSFQPRTLKLDGLEAFRGQQLAYRVDDLAAFAGQRVVVVGGDDTALNWALQLAQAGPQAAASVTLLHRRDVFQAAPDLLTAVAALRLSGRLQFIAGQASGFDTQQGRLTQLQVAGSDGSPHTLPLDHLLVGLGLSPKLGPIADWGLALERKQLVVDPASFETSVPGIFAVGDIVSYLGKRKLIVSGFHEATLAAFAAAARVFPDKPVLLQYTTTSPRLHQLLGLGAAGPAAD